MTIAPARDRAQCLLPATARHLVGRFSYGITPSLARQVRAAGGARAWFEQQLDPGSIADGTADALRSWWSGLSRTPTELWYRQRDDIEGGWEVMLDYQRWVLLRRIHSRRPVLEMLTELWENHFNVPASGDAQCFWRVDFGDTVRTHALGRFEDLLQAVTTHPAMLINLDNVSSDRTHPNENLGRELLELHTVGRGEYGEADVKASAQILTGWSVDMWDTFRAEYRTGWHWRGPVQVIGFSDPNADADGRRVTADYLSYLAHHPATARRVARRLAVKFVGDDPSDALVTRLAQVYLDQDTAIRPVLRALVASDEFARSVGAKVRDPGEDLVATYRALDVRFKRPPATGAGERYAANQLLWQVADMGIMPFGWPRPDGQPIDNRSWSSPSRMLASMSTHVALAGSWWPDRGVTYHPPTWWVPRFPVRFDVLVDHVSRRILHRPASPLLLRACCEATGLDARERITRDHPLMRWDMFRVLSTFLDSPTFLTR